MRSDFLNSAVVDRSQFSSLQHKIVRGTISHLLITNSTTWHYKDQITVKLRHAGGMTTIVDRISALTLALLTDLKQGFPTTGTPRAIGDQDVPGENDKNGGYVSIATGVFLSVNAILLPLGHITLTGREELEVIVECAPQTLIAPATSLPVGRIRLSSLSDRSRVDTIYSYDQSSDLESNQGSVREIYLVGKKGATFFNALPDSAQTVPLSKAITIKLNVDGDDSETDVETCGALTAITCMLTQAPSSLLLVMRDYESAPANVYLKVYGDDKDMAEVLYVRETPVPHLIGQSMYQGFSKELRRVEAYENSNPEEARALRQTGKIASSETMKDALDSFIPAISAPTR
jgi:hypothetical protein